jgi:hypothetical protein
MAATDVDAAGTCAAGRTFLFLDGAVSQKVFEFGHEFLDVLEVHVDTGETDVGDFVEFLEAMHDHLADFGGSKFAFRRVVDHPFDFIDDGFKLGRGNGSLFASLQEALEDFLALETLAATVLLDHHVRDFVDAFVGGEAAGTFQALPAATDGVAGAAFAGIDYLVIEVGAERTFHAGESPVARRISDIGNGISDSANDRRKPGATGRERVARGV